MGLWELSRTHCCCDLDMWGYVHTATASSGLVGSKRVMVGDKVDSVKYCRPPFG